VYNIMCLFQKVAGHEAQGWSLDNNHSHHRLSLHVSVCRRGETDYHADRISLLSRALVEGCVVALSECVRTLLYVVRIVINSDGG
jgi:hypothetical protein